MKNLKIKIVFLILIVFIWSTTITLAKDNNSPDIKNTLLKLIIHLLAQVYKPPSLSSIVPEPLYYPPQVLPPLPENPPLEQQNLLPSSEPPTSSFPSLEVPPLSPQPRPPETNPIDAKIPSRPLWLGACGYSDREKYECNINQLSHGNELFFSIHPMWVISYDIVDNLESDKIKSQISNYIWKNIDKIDQISSTTINIGYTEPHISVNAELTFKECLLTTSTLSTNADDIYFQVTCPTKLKAKIYGSINVNDEKIFDKKLEISNTSEDMAAGTFDVYVEGEYVFMQSAIKNSSGIKFNYPYFQPSKNPSSVIYKRGHIKDLNFRFSLNASEDLSNWLRTTSSSLIQFFGRGSKIKRLHWNAFSHGNIEGLIDGSWEIIGENITKAQVNKLEFCPSTCEISIKEVLDLEAEKVATFSDKRQGPITIYEEHSEKFSGTGEADPKSGAIFWQNVTIDKEDIRKWDRKIDFLMPDGKSYKWSYYQGDIHSKAELKPYSNYSYISSTIYKNLSFDEVFPFFHPSSSQSYFIRTNLATIKKRETNINGSLNREGEGTVSFTSPNRSFTIKGIYDSLSALMKVVSPQEMAEQRIDPIDYLNPGERAIDISPLFGPGGLYVHGFFTATYGNPTTTVATTRPVKLLPKTVVVLWSFKQGDPAFSQSIIKRINQVLAYLTSSGVTVIEYNTKNKPKMIEAFNKIPNNSWVLNVGHGTPLGLMAGKYFVSYLELKSIIEKKNLKIDGFTGITCYFGRSSLGQRVIGSLGLGATGGGINFPLGRIVGFGTNSWNLTADDILSLFCPQ